jgi:ElaB/YqjD/DUF883 family membrane-anchored ribosome-binding protein
LAHEAKPMFDTAALRNELQALKEDLSRLLNTTSEGLSQASRSRADALTGQVQTALSDLTTILSEQEDHLETLIAERPVATLASAFALGVVVGLMLRRH